MLSASMQNRPLLVSSLIQHASSFHGDAEIVSRTLQGDVHRCTYRDIHRRARQLANALTAVGVKRGDRVATIAWNGHRHMELYYAVSGMGAVLHTINPRLPPEQIEYVVNHAEDQWLFFDVSFTRTIEELAPRLRTLRGFVALTDRSHAPATQIPGLLHYEELLAEHHDDYEWPIFDETAAASLCYTSGTTGNPKGVLYSHRSTVLHAFAACAVDGLGLSAMDSALVVVPMFHVNAWGMPYAGAMCGAKLVLPGGALDGKSLFALLRDERVTVALGVPTVWLGLFQYVADNGISPKRELDLRRVVIGGSAAPRSMCERFAEEFGAFAVHAWGMTEMSPLGTVGNLLPKHAHYETKQRLDVQIKQGRPVFGVELRIVDDEGRRLPHDGKVSGHLQARGPWIAGGYFKEAPGSALDADGFFPTGDIASIDADGYLQITDRSKDVIKSGGEWISSIALENSAMGHPAVAEAAAIGVPHPKWQERPLLVVVKKPGCEVTAAELRAWLSHRVIRWWCPEDIMFVAELPHGATGKLLKSRLREMFSGTAAANPE